MGMFATIENNKPIAKNTLNLYVRMLLSFTDFLSILRE